MSESRLLELLADRATEGLDSAASDELERLLARFPETDDEALEIAAATIDAAFAAPSSEPLPDALRARIEADAPPILARQRLRPAPAPSPSSSPTAYDAPTPAPAAPRRWLDRAGWALAAGLAGWLVIVGPPARRALPPTDPATAERLARADEPAEAAALGGAAAAERDAAALRDRLLASEALRVAWSPTGDAAGPEASGDVVWSDALQQGVMRFRGLAANDPERFQYQLWIFDGTRDERYPVDGGVFDVASDGEDVLVPIRATLPVRSPTLFAVTVEEPGGVVVSARERIAVVAAVEATPANDRAATSEG